MTPEPFAVRVGARFVQGLRRAHWERLEAARAAAPPDRPPFASIEDLARRAALPRDTLRHLAEADALAGLVPRRREALWIVQGLPAAAPDALPLPYDEALPALAPLDRTEAIVWDYEATGHSTRGHPLSDLRSALRAQGLPTAATLNATPDGRRARYAGLVIARQRPATAKGTTFMTLQDETGFVNLVVWAKVFERFSVLAKTQVFLGVTGRVQATAEPGAPRVTHLVAEALWVPDATRLPAAPATPPSRDFH